MVFSLIFGFNLKIFLKTPKTSVFESFRNYFGKHHTGERVNLKRSRRHIAKLFLPEHALILLVLLNLHLF